MMTHNQYIRKLRPLERSTSSESFELIDELKDRYIAELEAEVERLNAQLVDLSNEKFIKDYEEELKKIPSQAVAELEEFLKNAGYMGKQENNGY